MPLDESGGAGRQCALALSIIIPCYNAERFIGGLLQNLEAQLKSDALESCEIIAVNDGSKDSTESIIRERAARFPAIRLVSQENRGEGGARNAGIDVARGEWLCFLDSDDSLEEGSVAFILQRIRESPKEDLLCFAYTAVKDGRRREYRAGRLDGKAFSRDEFLKEFFLKRLPVHVCSLAIRRRLVEGKALQFSGLKIAADVYWLLGAFAAMESARFFDRPCFIYRIRDDSVMQGYKAYTLTRFKGFVAVRDKCLDAFCGDEAIGQYARFWLKNLVCASVVFFLRSGSKDQEIAEGLSSSLKYLRLPSARGAFKNACAISLARLLPLRAILGLRK